MHPRHLTQNRQSTHRLQLGPAFVLIAPRIRLSTVSSVNNSNWPCAAHSNSRRHLTQDSLQTDCKSLEFSLCA